MMGRYPRRQLAIRLLIRPRLGRSEGGQEQQKYDRQRFRHRPPRISPGPRRGRRSTGDLRTVSILWDRGGKLYHHCRIFGVCHMPSSVRVALITGCGKPVGIGNSTARALAAAGVTVVVSDVVPTGVANEHNVAGDMDNSWRGVDSLVEELV